MKRNPRQMQMGGVASETLALPAASLRSAVESLLGPISFADFSFPSAIACNPAMEHQVLLLPRQEAEVRFLKRFRQSGGHLPISIIDLSVNHVSWPEHIGQIDRTVVICLGTFADWLANDKRLSETGFAMLMPAPQNIAYSEVSAMAKLRNYRIIKLTATTRLSPQFFLFVRQPMTVAPMASPSSQQCTSHEAAFDCDNHQVVIDACGIIHDGGYLSEGDTKYSWLWTGPSTHFRIVVPHVAAVRPGRIEICIARTEDGSNIDLLAVQIDGRPVDFGMERWSETTGKLSVEIPTGDSYCILTLITPALTADTNSGRQIGLCLDKLIVTP